MSINEVARNDIHLQEKIGSGGFGKCKTLKNSILINNSL
jgi:hypothetical protein